MGFGFENRNDDNKLTFIFIVSFKNNTLNTFTIQKLTIENDLKLNIIDFPVTHNIACSFIKNMKKGLLFRNQLNE